MRIIACSIICLVASITTASWNRLPAPEADVENLLAGLPPAALQSYLRARTATDAGLAMRSWLSVWSNRLRDPAKALIQLDAALCLVEFRAKSESVAAAKKKLQGNAEDAKNIIATVKSRRLTDSRVSKRLEEVSAAAQMAFWNAVSPMTEHVR